MPIHIVGLGLDVDALPEVYADLINGASVLVGGKRQLSLFEEHHALKIPITSPLEAVFSELATHDTSGSDIVVLADGDPLFFGIGARMVEEFGPDGVQVYPNISSMQGAAARAKIPWQEVVSTSLHGRNNYLPLFNALKQGNWVAVLTDEQSIPAAIAQKLQDRGIDWFNMWVFENMGQEDEYFDRYTLAQASSRSFSKLNLVLLERCGKPKHQLTLGAPDELYQTERALITKGPVRAAGIAALRLEPHNVLWDLGAGSGAVSIEAAAILPHGEVWAIERNGNRVGMIRENRKNFGAIGMEIVHGTMPACLGDLPEPDRIFIGGGLGKNADVLEIAMKRLAPGGRIVVHSILLGTMERTRNMLTDAGWPVEISMLQASHSSMLSGDFRLSGLNPVFIIASDKPLA